MTNLVSNGDFNDISGSPFLDWTSTGGVAVNTNPTYYHVAPYSAQIGGPVAGSIDQTITGLTIGQAYRLVFWAASSGTSVGNALNVTITNGGFGTSFTPGATMTSNAYLFTPVSASIILSFTALTTTRLIYIDTVSIKEYRVCYTGDALVRVREISTGRVMDIAAREVRTGIHEVYDVGRCEYIPVRANLATLSKSSIYRIPKNIFADSCPNHDLYITGGHTVNISGCHMKVRQLPQAQLVKITPNTPLYTIATDTETSILINNMNVLTWNVSRWINNENDIQLKMIAQ